MHTRKSKPKESVRARPLAVEERQALIIEAVIPLLAVHGRDLTSKQIAEAAGVAEGTIFRAFGDKDTLITAAIDRFLDPAPFQKELQAIDRELGLEAKVLSIVTLMQNRFGEVFRIMAVVGHDRKPSLQQRRDFGRIIEEVLEPELAQLNLPGSRIAHIVRLLTFSASLPHLNHDHEITPEELTHFVLYGIAGKPVNEKTATVNDAPTESQD